MYRDRPHCQARKNHILYLSCKRCQQYMRIRNSLSSIHRHHRYTLSSHHRSAAEHLLTEQDHHYTESVRSGTASMHCHTVPWNSHIPLYRTHTGSYQTYMTDIYRCKEQSSPHTVSACYPVLPQYRLIPIPLLQFSLSHSRYPRSDPDSIHGNSPDLQ